MRQELVTSFVTLWVVLDPLSTISVFLGLTHGMEAARRKVLATKAVLIACVVLLFFIVAGQFLLDAMNIPLHSFQIAGGIVLFLFAIGLIFGETKRQPVEAVPVAGSDDSVAVFPLAIPTIAGPGAMLAVVLLTDKERYSFSQQFDTVVVLTVVLFLLWLALMLANPISRVIGASGANVLARIMGLLLAAVAVNNVLAATRVYVGTMVGQP